MRLCCRNCEIKWVENRLIDNLDDKTNAFIYAKKKSARDKYKLNVDIYKL